MSLSRLSLKRALVQRMCCQEDSVRNNFAYVEVKATAHFAAAGAPTTNKGKKRVQCNVTH